MFRSPFSPLFQNPLSSANAAPWWLTGGVSPSNCIAAYGAKGASNLAASYINLARPGTNNAAPGVAPTWDVTNGWIFTGTQWLTTGFTANMNTHSFFIRFSNVVGTGGYIGGFNNGSGARFGISPNIDGINIRFRYGTLEGVSPPYVTSGVLGLANAYGWRNGSKSTTLATLPSSSSAVIVGALWLSTTPANFLNGYIQAFAMYNSITDAQATAISAAMAAL